MMDGRLDRAIDAIPGRDIAGLLPAG
jgi:hypothetical protein